MKKLVVLMMLCMLQMIAQDVDDIESRITCRQDAFMCDVRGSRVMRAHAISNKSSFKNKNKKLENGTLKLSDGALDYSDDVTLASKGYRIYTQPVDSGTFLTLNVGMAITQPMTFSINNIFNLDITAGYSIGLEYGYRHFLGRNFGFKYYVDYSFSQSYGNSGGAMSGAGGFSYNVNHVYTHNFLAFNADIFARFSRYFGLYAGACLGVYLFEPVFVLSGSNAAGRANGTYIDRLNYFFVPALNVGLEFGLSAHSSLKLGGKMLFVPFDFVGRYATDTKFNTYLANVGFVYYF